MRDTRSYKIKKILKKHYPNAKFKAHILKNIKDKFIEIETDLIKKYPCGLFDYEHGYLKEEFDKILFKNREIQKNIFKLLKDYKNIGILEAFDLGDGGEFYYFIEKSDLKKPIGG